MAHHAPMLKNNVVVAENPGIRTHILNKLANKSKGKLLNFIYFI